MKLCILGCIFGLMLASQGFHLLTWQYWVFCIIYYLSVFAVMEK